VNTFTLINSLIHEIDDTIEQNTFFMSRRLLRTRGLDIYSRYEAVKALIGRSGAYKKRLKTTIINIYLPVVKEIPQYCQTSKANVRN
jgi:hypothetical protein